MDLRYERLEDGSLHAILNNQNKRLPPPVNLSLLDDYGHLVIETKAVKRKVTLAKQLTHPSKISPFNLTKVIDINTDLLIAAGLQNAYSDY